MHNHTTASDGTFTPTELVEKYAREGYSVIAVTDHDGMDGVMEAQEAGKRLGVKVIAGIEIGTVLRDRYELHILGYDFDIHDPQMIREMESIWAYREKRNQKLLKFFQESGYPITEKDLIQREGQHYIGKPNFARALVKKGYAESVSEVFRSPKLLASETASKLKQKKVVSRDAIRWIREAGGWAVLAHPMKVRGIGEKSSEEFFRNLENIVSELKADGLSGLECRHPSASEEDVIRLEEIADRYGLRKTRGSDFHGDR